MILTLRPNADGDLSQLTPFGGGDHYVEVDDTGGGDGDSTLVNTIFTTYVKDLYHVPNHTSEVGVINNIKAYFRFKSARSGETGYAKAYIKSDSTETAGDEQTESTRTYTLFSHTWTTNPATGSAWTWGEIDALQIGVALKGQTSKTLPKCTQVWVEVDYELAVRPKVGGSLADNRLVGGGLAKCI